MSWASIYWDLHHIVQAAREAMEAAYCGDMASQFDTPTISNATPASPSLTTDAVVIANLNLQVSGAPAMANVDPLRTAEIVLSIAKPTSLAPSQEIKTPAVEEPAESIEVSLSKSSIVAKMTNVDQPGITFRSPWTAEIEAALREFLRPLSVDLRYEYRFADVLDEKRSIAAINGLFKQPAKPEHVQIRDNSAQHQFRRKRSHELRRSGVFDTNTKRPHRKASK